MPVERWCKRRTFGGKHMSGEANTYVSIIGDAYIEPVCALLEKLLSARPQGANDLQASPRENGYSASIVLLSVVCLESILRRAMFVRGVGQQETTPLAFFEKEFSDSGLAAECRELFVLRDVVAHNHLWEAEHLWDDELTVLHASLLPGSGDKKYKNSIDWSTRRTKHLGLNLFPTRIHLSDVKTVLRVVVQILQYLHRVDLSIQSVPGIHWVRYGGQGIYFADLVRDLFAGND